VRSAFCIGLLVPSYATTLATIYTFAGGSDGYSPQAAPVLSADGILYGTTTQGGNVQCESPFGCGTVYALTPPSTPNGSWTKTILWVFGGVGDGIIPTANLAIGTGGVLYGVTAGGGNTNACPGGCGTVFSLSPPTSAGGPWTEAVIYAFSGGADGWGPTCGVLIAPNGILYGATGSGGASNLGTVYSLTPPPSAGSAWAKTVLHDFAGGLDDGSGPISIVRGKQGVLYGATVGGGDLVNGGTIFSLSPTMDAPAGWAEKILVRFADYWAQSPADGPLTNLVIGNNGAVYGTTGGIPSVWSLLPPTVVGGAWTETILSSSYLLGAPRGNIALSPKTGAIYGTSPSGGGSSPECGDLGCGTVWELTPPAIEGGGWVLSILHSFQGTDGGVPWAGLNGATDSLYGTTEIGGEFDAGTIFQLVP